MFFNKCLKVINNTWVSKNNISPNVVESWKKEV